MEFSNSKFSIYKIDNQNNYIKLHSKNKNYYKLFIQLLIDKKRNILN